MLGNQSWHVIDGCPGRSLMLPGHPEFHMILNSQIPFGKKRQFIVQDSNSGQNIYLDTLKQYEEYMLGGEYDFVVHKFGDKSDEEPEENGSS